MKLFTVKLYTKIRQLGRVSPNIVYSREISVSYCFFNKGCILVNMANLKPVDIWQFNHLPMYLMYGIAFAVPV